MLDRGTVTVFLALRALHRRRVREMYSRRCRGSRMRWGASAGCKVEGVGDRTHGTRWGSLRSGLAFPNGTESESRNARLGSVFRRNPTSYLSFFPSHNLLMFDSPEVQVGFSRLMECFFRRDPGPEAHARAWTCTTDRQPSATRNSPLRRPSTRLALALRLGLCAFRFGSNSFGQDLCLSTAV